MKHILFCIVFIVIANIGCASEPLKIAVMTDLHYLSPSLSSKGAALDVYERETGRDARDLHAVLDKVLADIENEQTDILLIPGDITNHGERQSHLDFIEKIRPLQENGMRIFVVPGNHDIDIPNAKAYIGEKPVPVESISAEEFAGLYASFGYADPLKRDTASMSYLGGIDEHTWLLCFDTNRYKEHTSVPITGGRILPQTMLWALDILREAKEKNITVLGLMHHGLVEHMPYQAVFFVDYLIADWKENAEILADNGLKVVFTGHFHSNDVSLLTSPAGNTIFDVETASLVQYPFAYRIMTLKDNVLSIHTRFVESISGKPALKEEYRIKFEKQARRVAENRLRRMGIPFPEETLDALTEVIVKMAVAHARGDEEMDGEMRQAVETFRAVLGVEEGDIESFHLDFPPSDNQLEIAL